MSLSTDIVPRCRVHPGHSAEDDPVKLDDAFDVPVFVRHRTPMKAQPRPWPAEVATAAKSWPSHGIPPSGNYRIRTSWRAVLQAAIAVGRDVTPWLSQVPHLAGHEILSRCAPLQAYLRRVPVGEDHVPPAHALVPNEVYLHGTEITAKGAFSYRIGMTMAEWLCWGQLGMSHSLHAESMCPPGTNPDVWQRLKKKPDLLGTHPVSPRSWVVEAKAERRLSARKLREGAGQLRLDDVVSGPHRRVLCGTSLEDRLFMTLDLDTRDPGGDGGQGSAGPPPAGPDPAADDLALYHLAGANMLTYLAILEDENAFIVPVGRTVDRLSGTQRNSSGAVTLLERNLSTSDLRAELRRWPGPGRHTAQENGIDMLATVVPGTGMTVGLSRRAYAACRTLLAWQQSLAEEARTVALREFAYDSISAEYQMVADPEQDLADDPLGGPQWVPPQEMPTESERIVYQRLRAQALPSVLPAVREAFRQGTGGTWESLTGLDPQLVIDGVPRQLESATADTYLAVDSRLVS